jgi:hypothetical protein
MSFDLFLISFKDGQNAPADAAAAQDVLSRARFRHEAKHDFYAILISKMVHMQSCTRAD